MRPCLLDHTPTSDIRPTGATRLPHTNTLVSLLTARHGLGQMGVVGLMVACDLKEHCSLRIAEPNALSPPPVPARLLLVVVCSMTAGRGATEVHWMFSIANLLRVACFFFSV